MSYNPPELKHEMQDTLFCIGIPFTYNSEKTAKGLVRTFHLTEADLYIDIYSPNFIRVERARFKSMYEVKCFLINKFRSLI